MCELKPLLSDPRCSAGRDLCRVPCGSRAACSLSLPEVPPAPRGCLILVSSSLRSSAAGPSCAHWTPAPRLCHISRWPFLAPSLLAALQRAFLLPSLPISSYVPMAFLLAGVSASFFREFTPRGMSFLWALLPSCSRKVGGASLCQCLRLRKTGGGEVTPARTSRGHPRSPPGQPAPAPSSLCSPGAPPPKAEGAPGRE